MNNAELVRRVWMNNAELVRRVYEQCRARAPCVDEQCRARAPCVDEQCRARALCMDLPQRTEIARQETYGVHPSTFPPTSSLKITIMCAASTSCTAIKWTAIQLRKEISAYVLDRRNDPLRADRPLGSGYIMKEDQVKGKEGEGRG